MQRRRHTPEQIVRTLREADKLLAEGTTIPEICRHLEISLPTPSNPRWFTPDVSVRPREWLSEAPPLFSGLAIYSVYTLVL